MVEGKVGGRYTREEKDRGGDRERSSYYDPEVGWRTRGPLPGRTRDLYAGAQKGGGKATKPRATAWTRSRRLRAIVLAYLATAPSFALVSDYP